MVQGPTAVMDPLLQAPRIYPGSKRLAWWIALSVLLHLIILLGAGPTQPSYTRPRPLQVELRNVPSEPPAVSPLGSATPEISAPGPAAEAMEPDHSISRSSVPTPAPIPVLPDLSLDVYYQSSEVDVRAEPINEVDLPYPWIPYLKRVKGVVRLEIFVNEQGGLDKVTVVEAIPPGVFEEAVLKAVNALRFSPAVKNGSYVKNRKTIEIVFDPYERINAPGLPSEPSVTGK